MYMYRLVPHSGGGGGGGGGGELRLIYKYRNSQLASVGLAQAHPKYVRMINSFS